MDSSIWQYNREWVRDQAFVAIGHLMAGSRDVAALLLGRLLREFITPEGGAMDSSEVRGPDEAELDQNGVLLYALEQYVRWTGDVSIIAEHWARIAAVAEYPLRPEFAHPESGLLVNSREFWERHRIHGIAPGHGTGPPGVRADRAAGGGQAGGRRCDSPSRRRAGRRTPSACGRRRCRIRDTASSATAPS